MKRGNVYSGNNSYLKVVEAGAQESDLAIYKIEDNQLVPVKELVCKNIPIALIEILPHQIFALKKVLPDLINKLGYKGRLHIILGTSSGFISIFSYLLIKRYLKRLKWFSTEVLGLIPDPHSPQIIMPLKRNVHQYLVSDFYRGGNSGVRRFMKKLIIILLGQFAWKGSIVFIVRRKNKLSRPEKTTEFEPWFADENAQDRFIFRTGEKDISFVFKKEGKKPEAVVKYGKLAAIEKEYINHSKAYALFPGWVPEIRFFKSEGETGKLCMEYIEDIHLNNVVASTYIRRRKKYLKEIEAVFLLLSQMLKSLPLKEGKLQDAYSYQVIKAILDGNLAYLNEREEMNNIKKVVQEVSDLTFPLFMQHRDLCLANILYTDRNREGKMIIDWEDCREDDLPLVDFNMLLISMNQVYRDLFERKEEDLFHDNDMMKIISESREEIREHLGMEEGLFKKISILSTVSLWSQNVQKGRLKISEEIFSFLNRELS